MSDGLAEVPVAVVVAVAVAVAEGGVWSNYGVLRTPYEAGKLGRFIKILSRPLRTEFTTQAITNYGVLRPTVIVRCELHNYYCTVFWRFKKMEGSGLLRT